MQQQIAPLYTPKLHYVRWTNSIARLENDRALLLLLYSPSSESFIHFELSFNNFVWWFGFYRFRRNVCWIQSYSVQIEKNENTSITKRSVTLHRPTIEKKKFKVKHRNKTQITFEISVFVSYIDGTMHTQLKLNAFFFATCF